LCFPFELVFYTLRSKPIYERHFQKPIKASHPFKQPGSISPVAVIRVGGRKDVMVLRKIKFKFL